jgi:hypothetical protein
MSNSPAGVVPPIGHLQKRNGARALPQAPLCPLESPTADVGIGIGGGGRWVGSQDVRCRRRTRPRAHGAPGSLTSTGVHYTRKGGTPVLRLV